MKVKVEDLEGIALDWAVAKAIGTLPASFDDWRQTWPRYSTVRALFALMVIEHRVSVGPHLVNGTWYGDWRAVRLSWHGDYWAQSIHADAQVAVARVLVLSKLVKGDDDRALDIPEELLQ
jgi:hypothetical protein